MPQKKMNGGSSLTLLCLKAILYNESINAYVPIGQSVQMSETMDTLLTAIKYHNHNFLLCGDLKVITLLLGLQGGYTDKASMLPLSSEWQGKQLVLHT